MRLLLDTHIFLWFVFSDSKLNAVTKERLVDPSNELFLSIASMWEITIKVSTGKLQIKSDVTSFFDEECSKNEILILPIETRHLAPLETMPFHHRDPFDRLLIAQSITENVPILSADSAFDSYADVTRLW